MSEELSSKVMAVNHGEDAGKEESPSLLMGV